MNKSLTVEEKGNTASWQLNQKHVADYGANNN